MCFIVEKMNKTIIFFKGCSNKFYFSLGINVLFLIFFNLMFYSRYHTVDDVFMEMIACGAFGKPDPHLAFMNSILGYGLASLYSLFGSIPWYGIMHFFFAFASFTAIVYAFFNRKNNISKILILVVIFIASYEAYTKIQFTKTAAYLAVAGYVLIAYSFEIKNRTIIQTFGIVFLLLSFMVRPGMFFGSSAICLGFILPKFFYFVKSFRNTEEKKSLIQLILIGFCSLFLIIVSFAVDQHSYSSERWSYYKKYNDYRSQLYDNYYPPYSDFENSYLEMGLTLEDCLLYSSGDMNDPELFNIEKMQEVINLQTNKEISLDEFVMFVLRGYNTLFKQKSLATFTVVALFLLILFVFASAFDIGKLFSLLFASFMAFIVFGYTYYMHGWFDRTTISVMFALIVTMLYIMEPKNCVINKVLCWFVTILMLVGSLLIWSEYFKWNRQEWKNEHDTMHTYLNEIYEDKEHLYISRVSFPMWKSYYTVYDAIRPNTMQNYATYGDWMINMPIYVDAMKEYDIVNPFKDIIDNEKAYLIGSLDNLEPIISYIQRHYNKDIEPVLVKTIGPYEAYLIKTNASQ